jgi:hypothetical protein
MTKEAIMKQSKLILEIIILINHKIRIYKKE